MRLPVSQEAAVAQFVAQITSVGTHFISALDLAAAREYIVKLAASSKTRRIVVCGQGLSSSLFPRHATPQDFEISSRPDTSRAEFFTALRNAEIGVSPVDLAVAETGTLVIATSDESERLVTALPKIHVALLPRSKLVLSLKDAEPYISRILGKVGGATISLISGSSRTADISHMLVLGVHGPKELHVCLLDQELPGAS